jgi:hypothetical protein
MHATGIASWSRLALLIGAANAQLVRASPNIQPSHNNILFDSMSVLDQSCRDVT